MCILWARKEANVSDVQEELTRQGTNLAYTTVMTTMARLETKRLLSRKRQGRFYVYRTRVSADEFRENTARYLAEHLVRGFESLGIASFVDQVAKIGPERLRELRELTNKASAPDDRPE